MRVGAMKFRFAIAIVLALGLVPSALSADDAVCVAMLDEERISVITKALGA